MTEISNDGLTQRIISEISGASQSAVSKALIKHKISPLVKAVRNAKYTPADSITVIKELSKNFTLPKLKRHCFFNFKGGTGKTSICYQVSSFLSLMGYKTLVVDVDPQGHLSTSLGYYNDVDYSTIYDRMVNNIGFKEIVKPIYKGLDCIPSNLSLTRLEGRLNEMPKREEQIKKYLREIEDNYDFILLDMNPTIGLLNWNVIAYVDVINIVCETQPYSVQALKLVFDELKRFFSEMEIPSKKIHVIPNKYEDRASSSAESMTILRNSYSEHMKPDFAIRKSEEINTSAKNGKPISFFAKKNSIAFQDLLDLTKYLLEISS